MLNLFQACRTADESYGIAAHYTQQLFPAAGALYVLNPSRNLVESVVSWGKTTIGEQVFKPDDCWALRRGKPHLIEQANLSMLCEHLREVSFTACLCVPMMAQGDALGILTLCKCSSAAGLGQTAGTVGGFTDAEKQLAATAAEHFGLALANLKLRETLRRQSVRDSLTGLFNRRYLEETLEREIHRAERVNSSLGVMMLDIDRFKHFNDMFGHAAGDALLQDLGNFLGRQVRASDVACRYGGEEFTLILPDTSLEVIQQRAEMLRNEIKQVRSLHSGKSLGAVTLSVGVALFPLHGVTSESLLHAADAALYQAKRAGRDRVVIAETNTIG